MSRALDECAILKQQRDEARRLAEEMSFNLWKATGEAADPFPWNTEGGEE